MEVAVYKGENILYIGTINECADHLGVLPKTIRFYLTPAYQRKIERRKNARNYLTVVKLDW